MFNPFFKNLIIYRLSRDLVIIRDGNTKELARQLGAFRFKPCGSQDMARSGWVALLAFIRVMRFRLKAICITR